MSEVDPKQDRVLPTPVETLQARAAGVQESAIEARARLCFRALAICLAALVLIFISMSLQIVTSAFVEASHGQRASPHAVAAQFAEAGDEPMEAAPPPDGWSHAIVAVISVLLVGDVILTIGLTRATFSMRLDLDRADVDKEKPPDGLGLPGVELLKAVTDAFATVIKGLPKR